MPTKTIRPLEKNELIKIVEYFHSASDDLLLAMGVDKTKLLPKEKWEKILTDDFDKKLTEKQSFYLGWEYNGQLIGHSSINQLSFGDHCNIHLHIWNKQHREQGLGLWFFKQSVNFFFDKFELKKLICEPYAENPAPNMILNRLGFRFVRKYLTTPGLINFEQYVNRYEITSPIEID